jgi:hypothetical protein
LQKIIICWGFKGLRKLCKTFSLTSDLFCKTIQLEAQCVVSFNTLRHWNKHGRHVSRQKMLICCFWSLPIDEANADVASVHSGTEFHL